MKLKISNPDGCLIRIKSANVTLGKECFRVYLNLSGRGAELDEMREGFNVICLLIDTPELKCPSELRIELEPGDPGYIFQWDGLPWEDPRTNVTTSGYATKDYAQWLLVALPIGNRQSLLMA